MSMIRVGTCSWTEKTLIQSGEFYPPDAKTAEERLRFYASEFDTVEVDATYYAIPTVSTTMLWAQRTPDGFIFHVKVYGGLTGHGVDPKTLPQDLRGELSAAERGGGRIFLEGRSVLASAAAAFVSALRPLRDTDRLGLLVYQYPPWFRYSHANLERIGHDHDLLKGMAMAVEFRHGSWLLPGQRGEVLSFLRERGITYITADEPQYGSLATIPFLPEATTDTAYFRFHGRNRENWLKRGIETSLRYDYEYTEEELQQLSAGVRETAGRTKKTYAMFNNCHGASAIRNAGRMKEIAAG